MTAVFPTPATAHGFPYAGGLLDDRQNRLAAQQTRPYPVLGQHTVSGFWDEGVTVHGHDPDAMFFQFIYPQLRRQPAQMAELDESPVPAGGGQADGGRSTDDSVV